jgi:DNA-binding NarL/FixJ family response regulator
MIKDFIKVLIYEDNDDLRESLVQLVQTDKNLLCVANLPNCSHAEQDIRRCEPHVVLMDIDMPGISGIEGVSIIKAMAPEVHVIMLTVFDDNDRVFESICAGASGYLLKKSSNEKILESIRDVMEGGAPMTSRIAKQVLALFSENHPSKSKTPEYNLSKRESETLSWLVKGYSYKMIAVEMEVSIDTIRSHIKKIYEKLHVHSMNEAVSKAIRNKIV